MNFIFLLSIIFSTILASEMSDRIYKVLLLVDYYKLSTSQLITDEPFSDDGPILADLSRVTYHDEFWNLFSYHSRHPLLLLK